jgi:hypothetical protein
MQRALRHLCQEERERSRGDSLSPVRPADPVANLAHLWLAEAGEVANHLPIDHDSLIDIALVGANPGCMRHECLALSARNGSHRRRLRLLLIFIEGVQVAVLHVAQSNIASHALLLTEIFGW